MEVTEQQIVALAQTFATQMATAPKGNRAQLQRAARFSKNISGAQGTQIQKKIKDNEVHVREYTVVYTVALKSASVKLYESNVQKKVGLVTINQGKFAGNQYFAPSSVRALVGIAPNATPTDAQLLALNYQDLNAFPAIETGELNIKIGNDSLFENFSLSAFDTTGRNDIITSSIEIDNPILFVPDTQMIGTVEFNADVVFPSNAYLQIIMRGAEMTIL